MGRSGLPEGWELADIHSQHWTQTVAKTEGCFSPQQRLGQHPEGPKVMFHDGPEEAGPWRPVVKQVQPPPSAQGLPSAGVALSRQPSQQRQERPRPQIPARPGAGRGGAGPPSGRGYQQLRRGLACRSLPQGVGVGDKEVGKGRKRNGSGEETLLPSKNHTQTTQFSTLLLPNWSEG